MELLYFVIKKNQRVLFQFGFGTVCLFFVCIS